MCVLLSSMVCLMQVYCYEDSKLLKLFSNVVRILYDADIVGEDTIKFWYKKGSHPKVWTGNLHVGSLVHNQYPGLLSILTQNPSLGIPF